MSQLILGGRRARKRLEFSILVLVVCIGLLSETLAGAAAPAMKLADYEVGNYAIGGNFTLTDQNGHPVSLNQYQGRVVVIFFGYTHCADICPLTLSEMGRLAKAMAKDSAKIQPLFITVDPTRDTVQRMKSYLGNFSKTIVGLTGTQEQIQAVATRYQAKFKKTPFKSGQGYSIDHTGFVYMLDPQQKVRYLFPFDAKASLLAEGARHLLGS